MVEIGLQSREHLDLLYSASLEFNSTLSVEELLPAVFERVIDALDAEAGSVWLRQGDTLVCHIARGPVGEKVEGLELPLGAGIVGHLAQTGEAELVADARGDRRFVHQVDEATGFATRSMVAAPLTAQGEVLGVLQVLNKSSGSMQFDEDDLALLTGLASTAGLALRNAQLHAAERQAHDLKVLLGISREMMSTLDVDRLAFTVVNAAGQALAYDKAAIALDSGGKLELRAVSGEESLGRSERNKELERLIAWLSERDELVYVTDLEADTETATSVRDTFGRYVAAAGIRSLALVPLKDEEGRLGAFYMESVRAGFLGDAGREAAELLGLQLAVSIRNADLYEQVPFIGILEPLAVWRRKLASMPRRALLLRFGIPALLLLLILMLPWQERIKPTQAHLRAGAETPVRATVGGVLSEIRVAEGGWVGSGDILAILSDDQLVMQMQETTAQLAVAQREAAAARARGDDTAAEIARIDAIEFSNLLEVLRQRHARTSLRAPVSGVVLTLRPEERLGEHLSAGETFVVIGSLNQLELEARVRQRDIARVAPGQRVRLKAPAQPEYTFVGTVTEVSAYADSPDGGEPTFTVRANLENEHNLLRPGVDVKAKIVGARRPLGYLLARPFIQWIQLRFWR